MSKRAVPETVSVIEAGRLLGLGRGAVFLEAAIALGHAAVLARAEGLVGLDAAARNHADQQRRDGP